MVYDLVIKNGLIVDGNGTAAYEGDLAIVDGRIVAIGEIDGDAQRTIDATGHVVAPGFVDAHTHYDAQLFWDPSANPSTVHGVTTVLLGNCGYTLAPVKPQDQGYLMGLFATAEEIPKAALEAFSPLAWETFPEYLEWLDGRVGLNVITQIGHSALRRYVMGEASLEGPATNEQIAEMVRVAVEAMQAGAAGISSSQAPHQLGEFGEHIPSYFADDAELDALALAVKESGKRLVSINPASKRQGLVEADRELLVRLAEISGAVVSWNDFGQGTPNGEGLLQFMEAQQERGHQIYAVARCQRGETRFTLKKLSSLFAAYQPWPDYSLLDKDAKIAALGDPQWRASLGAFWDQAKFMLNASVEKVVNPALAPLEGRLLVDIAAERGVHPADVMFDVAKDDELETFFRISGRVDADESHVERILRSPATLVGISDGGAHLQTFAGGDYPSYFLQHWVREKSTFSLEAGVAALSSRIADVLGLSDRGRLEVGKAADVVVFDADTVGPLELQTLDDIPNGGTRMTKGAGGIPWVLVNGEPVIENGVPTSALAGRVLGRNGH